MKRMVVFKCYEYQNLRTVKHKMLHTKLNTDLISDFCFLFQIFFIVIDL